MKIVAINGCAPNSADSLSILLEQFLDGAKESGAEIDIIDTSELNIQPCKGCTEDIGFISNGKCKCEDDMDIIYPKLRESDAWIFATPNRKYNPNSSFKNLIDRLEPLFQMHFEESVYKSTQHKQLKKKNKSNLIQTKDVFAGTSEPFEESSIQSSNEANPNGYVVFISSGEEWDKESFKPLVDQFESLSKLFSRHYAGSIIRPHDRAFEAFMHLGIPVYDILEAARDAGRQFVTNHKISDATLKTISRQLITKNSFFHEVYTSIYSL